jgi:class 3 adenylate cyclase/predicted ATPase
MFADIQGFTALSEQLDFESVSDLIKEVWLRLDHVIQAHNGYIDKHIGDEVMAVWGAPEGGEDDAPRAVAAALAMQEALHDYASSSQKKGAEALRLRIGVNTGFVLATYLGLKNEYTVIGDTVNVAARMQDQAPPGRVMITESTYKMVRDRFRVQRMGPLKLRGKTEPIAAYRVLGARTQPVVSAMEGSEGSQSRIVGRAVELERLDAHFEQVRSQRRASLVLLVGDPGIGKSRLILEFTSRLEAEYADASVLFSRALSETQKAPFYIWKSLWSHQFDFGDNTDPKQSREKLLRGIVDLWGQAKSESSAIEAAHLIGKLIGLDWPGSPYLEKYHGEARLRAERAFELTQELIARMSERGPVVLILEDLQWADQRSLDLLNDLLQPGARPATLLVVGSARPGFLRGNVHWSNLAAIERLAPLELSSHLVREAFPELVAVPDPILAQVAEKSGGNPYFLEEIVKSLLRTEGLGPHAGAEFAVENLADKLPGNLQALLQARLDDLPREVRDVALLASVVGRVFWEGAIVAAARQPVSTDLLNLPENVLERVVQNALRHLVRVEMAFPRAGGAFTNEREYVFKNSLLRDAAYQLIPHKHLNYYHYAIARWLGDRAGDDFAAHVAEHYEKAGHFSRALRHYETAASYAESNGADQEAIELRTAIKTLRSGDQPHAA